MSDATPRLGLPWLMPAQAQKHVTVNESLGRLDALIQCAVASRTLAVQPASPAHGEAWILPAGANGADWDGFVENDIAYFQDGAWRRIAARTGLTAYVSDEGALLVFDGADWAPITHAITALSDLDGLGVGTAPDSANPFAAKLNAALWTARYTGEGGTGDLRYTLNKETAGDTLSFLFQTAWSGRAEIGLTGSDDLSVKVSADGSSWSEALTVARGDGRVGLDRCAVSRLEHLNGGPLAGLRNRVINGGFSVWQRGPGPFSADYTADQWKIFANSSDTITISREALPAGQGDIPGDPQYFLRYSVGAGGSASGVNDITQPIENVETFNARPVVLSYYARASAAVTVRSIIRQHFGAGGSPNVVAGTMDSSITTGWARYEHAVTLISTAGKTLAAGNALDVILRVPTNVDVDVDFACVQLEAGEVATPFEHRPPAVELSLCRRFYERKTVRSQNGSRHIALCPKRAAPSVTVTPGTAGHVTEDGFELTHTAAADSVVEASAEL